MERPVAILYEHPQWFAPLFAELDRRKLPYVPLLAHEHSYNPDDGEVPYSLVVNRVSPSSYLRDHANAIFYTQQYLSYLEERGVPVVNGANAYSLEISKARQLSLLASLGLPHPRSLVVSHAAGIRSAAEQLTYPVIVKPNIGGSGALMRRFDLPAELELTLAAGELDDVFGLDHTAIVQEYHPQRGGSIVRVEVLNGQLLYAIRIFNDPGQGFNLCPADICQIGDEQQPQQGPSPTTSSGEEFEFCPVEAPAKKALRIEVATPPAWVVESVLRVFEAASIDVGGVEYLESERDGQIYFYDVNALSNFVTDAPTLVGFDPFVRFADYIESRVGVPVPVG